MDSEDTVTVQFAVEDWHHLIYLLRESRQTYQNLANRVPRKASYDYQLLADTFKDALECLESGRVQ